MGELLLRTGCTPRNIYVLVCATASTPKHVDLELVPYGLKGRDVQGTWRQLLGVLNQKIKPAGRVARGRSGTLRVGFAENASWRGVVPEFFRRFRALQPDAELQLQPSASLEQLGAIRSGHWDAGFVHFMPKSDPELDQLLVARQNIELARAEKASAHTAQETPPAGPDGCAVCLVSQVSQPAVL
jgi:DNA-binding transcriptional LysR family regulator